LEPLPDDVEFLSELRGHTKKVTCLELDQASGQLFTGSYDGTVRVWSCSSGECTSTVPVGGEVDSMLIEGGFLFAGVKTPTAQGFIKAWNMATNQEMVLQGHTGRVECLAAAQGMLFSGGQDQTIRVWKPNATTGMFECAAVLRAEHNGHTSAISSMCVSQHIMFSGDLQGGIKVWDLNQGAVIQTLDKAHSDNSYPAIMSMLIWEGHLVTGSLDGYIKVWEPADPGTGSTISGTPIFIFPEAPPQQAQQGGGRGGGRSKGRGGGYKQPPPLPGVLSLCGVADPEGKAVVMVSYNHRGKSAIRLWELPSFADRGALADVNNVRAMAGFPAGKLMISGDEEGRVKVWRWKSTPPGGVLAGASAAAGPGGFPA
jgi:F-box/WD-40 domain protein 7